MNTRHFFNYVGLRIAAATIIAAAALPFGAAQPAAAAEAVGPWGFTVLRRANAGSRSMRPKVAVDPVTSRPAVAFIDHVAGKVIVAVQSNASATCGVVGWECTTLEASDDVTHFEDVAVTWSKAGSLFVAWSSGRDGWSSQRLHLWQRKPNGTTYVKLVIEAPTGEYGKYHKTVQPSLVSVGDHDVLLSYRRSFYRPDFGWDSYDYNEDVEHDGYNDTLASTFGWLGDHAIEDWGNDYSYPDNGHNPSVSWGAVPAWAYSGGGSARTLRYGELSGQNTTCEDAQSDGSQQATCHTVDALAQTGHSITLFGGRDGVSTQIGYVDRTNGYLKRARWVGGSTTCNGGRAGWGCEVIDAIGTSSEANAAMTIAISRTVFAYHDADSGGVLKVARYVGTSGTCGAGKWQCTIVDNGAGSMGINQKTGLNPSIASDKGGRVWAAYTSVNGDVIVASEKTGTPAASRTMPTQMQSQVAYQVTYKFTNPSAAAYMSGVQFEEQFSGGLAVLSSNLSSSGCNNSVSVDLVNNKIKMINGLISPSATCTINVWVKAVGQPGNYFFGSNSKLVSIELKDVTLPQVALQIIAPVGANTAPTITPIADQTIMINANTGFLPFTVTDSSSVLTVSVQTSNPQLLPLAGITLRNTVQGRSVKILPFSDRSGVGTITIVATDGQLTTYESFVVNVMDPNAPPPVEPAEPPAPEPPPAPEVPVTIRTMLPMVVR